MGDDEDFTDPFEQQPGGEDIGEEVERPEIDFRGGYKERQHAIGIEVERARTAEEMLIEEVKKVLDSSAYSSLRRDEKDDIIDRVQSMSNLRLYNLPALVLARIWFLKHSRQNSTPKGIPIDPKEFKSFISEYEAANVSPVDLIRYIRMLEK